MPHVRSPRWFRSWRRVSSRRARSLWRRPVPERLEDRHLLAAGDLDPTFHFDGKVSTEFGEAVVRSDFQDVVVQPDGKLVAIGSSDNRPLSSTTRFSPFFALARYLPDGSLDPAFGTMGRVSTSFSGTGHSKAAAHAVTLLADGRILLAGRVDAGPGQNDSGFDFALARYLPDGSLDESFGAAGRVQTDLGSATDQAFDILVQEDGKIVLAGTSGGDVAVARYHPQGTLDPSFDGDGFATADLGGTDVARAVAVQADGKIVVTGTDGTDVVLLRFNSDGSRDTSFAGGVARRDLGGSDAGHDLELVAGGAIVVAAAGGGDFAVLRFLADGMPDNTFDHDGLATANLGGADVAESIRVLPDGTSILGGSRDGDFAVARFTATGQLDTAFDGDGFAIANLGSTDTGRGLALQTDGKIVIAGSAGTNAAVARFLSEGQPDSSFDGDGKLTTSFVRTSAFAARDMVVQDDGKVILIGSGNDSPAGSQSRMSAWRYHPDGTIDTSYGTNGRTKLPAAEYGTRAALQANGKLLLGGSQLSQDDFILARLNTDGTPDTTFGNQGVTKVDLAASDVLRDLLIQPDGKIVALGSVRGSLAELPEIVLVRFHTGGTLDTDFGDNGKLFTGIPSLSGVRGARQSTGKLLLGGTDLRNEFFVTRFHADGSLDASFGSGGTVSIDLQGSRGELTALTVQADDTILVGGTRSGGLVASDFAVLRLEVDGSLDPTWDGDGRAILNLGGVDEATSLILQADGKVLVGGSTFDLDSRAARFAVVRLGTTGVPDASFGIGGVARFSFPDQGRFSSLEAIRVNSEGAIYAALALDVGFVDPVGLARLEANPVACPPAGCLSFSRFDTTMAETAGSALVEVVRTGGSAGTVTVHVASADLEAAAGSDYTAVSTTLTFAPGVTRQSVSVAVAQDELDEGNERLRLALNAPGGGAVLENPRVAELTIEGVNSLSGRLDRTFGSNGIAQADFGGRFDAINELVLQSDGKLIAVGEAGVQDSQDFLVARFLKDGSLDPTFGAGGLLQTDFLLNRDTAKGVAIQPDARIVVVGEAGYHPDPGSGGIDFIAALARFRPDGTLDRTFGKGGRVVLDPRRGARGAEAVVVLPDGKLLVSLQFNSAAGLARFHPDGQLDAGFGVGGVVSTDRILTTGQQLGPLVLPDGRIVLAGRGRSGTGAPEFPVVARFLAGGVLDDSFGSGGVVELPAGDYLSALARQPDGKLLLAGSAFNRSDRMTVSRLNSDGSPDRAFGDQGTRTLAIRNDIRESSIAVDLVLQPDGKIVVGGHADLDDSFDRETWVLARLRSDGSLDTSFGGNGLASVPLGENQLTGTNARALAIASDNGLLLAGTGLTAEGDYHFSVARFLGDPQPGRFEFLRSSFDVDENAGLATITVRRRDGAFGAVQVDYVTSNGSSTATPNVDYTPVAGTLTFDDGQILKTFTIPVLDNPPPEGPETIDLQLRNPSGGTELADGHTAVLTIYDGPGAFEFSLPLFNANETGGLARVAIQRVRGSDGAASVRFVTRAGTASENVDFQDGTTTIHFADGETSKTATVAVFDDQTLEGRESVDLLLESPTGGAALADRTSAVLHIFDLEPGRGTSPGSLDPAFGIQGIGEYFQDGVGFRPYDMVRQTDGGLVVVGEVFDERDDFTYRQFDFGLVRFHADGARDSSFGVNGLVRTDFGGDESARAVSLQADGKLVVGGFSRIHSSSDFALARYLPDGRLDPTFDGDGWLLTDLNGNHDSAFALTVQGAHLYLAGTTGNLSFRDFAIVRYLAHGARDADFGSQGVVTTDFGGVDAARDLAFDGQGRLVVGGDTIGQARLRSSPEPSADFALARYLSDGTLDATFGAGGKVTTDFRRGGSFTGLSDDDVLHRIALQPDGKILAVGEADQDFAIARYLPDGSLDLEFSGDGLVDFGFVAGSDSTSSNDAGRDVVVQPDGRIVVAGLANGGELGLVRLEPDGRPDVTFGARGLVHTEVLGPAHALALQPDGQLVTASRFFRFDGNIAVEGVQVARFLGASACPIQGCFQFTAVSYLEDERDGQVTITVSRPPDAADGPATIAYATLAGTALAGHDFEPVTGTLFFNDTVSTASFAVPLIDDGIHESLGDRIHESFLVLLSNPTGGAVLGAQTFAEVVIRDDDPIAFAPGEFRIGFTNRSVQESGGAVTVTVERLKGAAGAVSVDFETRDGTAVEGEDYGPVFGTLSFANGERSRTFTVPVMRDTRLERNEHFIVALTNPRGGARLQSSPSQANFTILDVDPLLCNNAGDLHAPFGSQGLVRTNLGQTENEEVYHSAVFPDGKVLVAGRSGIAGAMGLARYLPDGTLDATFGTGGLVHTDVRSGTLNEEDAFGIVPLTDNRFLVLGRALAGADDRYLIARYQADGSLDTTFGTAGFVFHPLNLFESELPAFAVQPDGKIVAAGSAYLGDDDSRPFGDSPSALALMRFQPDGTLDRSFGRQGQVVADYGLDVQSLLNVNSSFRFHPTVQDTATGVAIGADGKIVVAIEDFGMRLARFHSDGSVDTDFGDEGLLSLETLFDSDTQFVFGELGDVLVQPDGKIVAVAGGSFDPSTQFGDTQQGFLVVRLNPDGTPDMQFGSGGLSVVDFGSSASVHSATLQTDQRIVVAGGVSGDFALARLLSDGRPDPGFGAHGRVLTEIGFSGTARHVLVLDEGRIHAAGHNSSEFVLARYAGGTATGLFRLRTDEYRVSENGGSLEVVVERVCGLDGDTTVELATAAGSAREGVDFHAQTRTLTFPSFGLTRQAVAIEIIDDDLAEGNLDFQVTLRNPTGGAGLHSVSSAAVTIVDDEQPGRIQFAAIAYRAAENLGQVTVTLERVDGDGGPVSVQLSAAGGTATPGEDYPELTPIVVSFAHGARVQTLELTITDDDELEGDETVLLSLSNPGGGAALGFRPTARVTIVDDERPQSGRFGFGAAEYLAQEADGAVEIPVQREEGSAGVATLEFFLTAGTAASPLDFAAFRGTLGFADGQTSSSIRIPITDDDEAGEGTESFTVTLANPTGGATLGSNSVATVRIADNDEPAAVPDLAIDDVTVLEGNSGTVTAIFTVSLSAASLQTIEVGFATQNDSARADQGDFEPASGQLVFTPGTRTQTIAILVRGDNLSEGEETFRVRLIGATGPVRVLDAEGTGTIRDDDQGEPADPGVRGVRLDTVRTDVQDFFGAAIDIDGDTMVVGSPARVGVPGEAFVFIRQGDDWVEQARLAPPDPSHSHQFGRGVAVHGDTVAVFRGSSGQFGAPDPFGAVYIYRRSGASWSLERRLSVEDAVLPPAVPDPPRNVQIQERFLESVDLQGDRLIVGGSRRVIDNPGPNDVTSVMVNVFRRVAATWTHEAKLTSPETGDGSTSTFDVALDGDTLVTGMGLAGQRAVVFVRQADQWSRQAVLAPDDLADLDDFGGAVDVSGDTLVVGADRADIPGVGSNGGAAYVFQRSQGVWTQHQKLTAPQGSVAPEFGTAVSISGHVIAVGSALANGYSNGTGAVYLFHRGTAADWGLSDTLFAPDLVRNFRFGAELSLVEDRLAIGAFLEPSAYVYEVAPPTDYGDAPHSYGTRPLSGASHVIAPGPFLGARLPDGEDPSAGITQVHDFDLGLNASSDDDRGHDDDDGVTFGDGFLLLRGRSGQARVTIGGSQGNARLYAFIDFNGDGDFDESNERIADGSIPLPDGERILTWTVPADAPLGNTYARFRVATTEGLSFAGRTIGGEVEDYRLCIADAGQVAVCQLTDSDRDDLDSEKPQLSADGRYVVYESGANATGRNFDSSTEIFLYDVVDGRLSQITDTRRPSQDPAINANGSRIAFKSLADLTGGNPDFSYELFLYDANSAAFRQLTNISGAVQLERPTLDAAGTRVAFLADFDPLGRNLDRNLEVFLYDLDTSTLVQLTDHPANSGVIAAAQISGNGEHVVFHSNADLAGSNSDRNHEIFVVSRTGVVQQLTDTTGLNRNAGISHDGRRIVFESTADLPGAPNPQRNSEIVLWERDTGTFLPITATASVSSTMPAISADGKRVAFASAGDFAGTGNFSSQIFVYDTLTRHYIQVNGRSRPSLDGDGDRVAFSDDRNVTGDNPEGVTELFLARVFDVTLDDLDFGDAPQAAQSGFAADYPTRLPDGARHGAASGLRLGTNRDGEVDGQPSAHADGDGADEDGIVVVATPVAITGSPTLASFLVTASAAGKLDAWIDFNRDGDWQDAGEFLFESSLAVTAGANLVAYQVPAGSIPGETFARFRLSSAGNLQPTGLAVDGEVEDISLVLLDGNAGAQAAVQLVVGDVQGTATDGDVVVVLHGTRELLRVPRGSLTGLAFVGTAAGDHVALGHPAGASAIGFPLTYQGGDGSDRLQWIESAQRLDLSPTSPHQLANLEEIDIAGSGANELVLSGPGVVAATDANNRLLVRHGADDRVEYQGTWQVLPPQFVQGVYVHVVRQGSAEVLVVNTLPWQNPVHALDATRDGVVAPLDVLVDFNTLNELGSRLLAVPTPDALPEFYYDSNGDGFVSPLDPLLKINFLNGVSGERPEGEAHERAGTLALAGEAPEAPGPRTLAPLRAEKPAPVSNSPRLLEDRPASTPSRSDAGDREFRAQAADPPMPSPRRENGISRRMVSEEDWEELLYLLAQGQSEEVSLTPNHGPL